MFGFLAMLQWQIGSVPPAIRFAGEKRDAVASFRSFDEGREIGWQRSESEAIDERVPFVVPGVRSSDCELQENEER